MSISWNLSWAVDVLGQIGRSRSRTSFLRVVFLADPRTTWQLIRSGTGTPDAWMGRGIGLTSLGPWHDAALRQWVEDCGFRAGDPVGRQRIAMATGNWSNVLSFSQQSFPRRAATVPDENYGASRYCWQRAQRLTRSVLVGAPEPEQQSDRGVVRHHSLWRHFGNDHVADSRNYAAPASA